MARHRGRAVAFDRWPSRSGPSSHGATCSRSSAKIDWSRSSARRRRSSPNGLVRAAELGADFIKIYPVATVGGPAYVTNVRRALQLLPLVVTGNIEYDEIPAYLAAGVVGFGIGGPLIPADILARGDHAAL